VDVIVPNPPELLFPFGARKFVRLNRLNASSRISTLELDPTDTCLLSARSTCQNDGPRTELRGAFPQGLLGPVGMTTQEALKYAVMVGLALAGSHVMFGR